MGSKKAAQEVSSKIEAKIRLEELSFKLQKQVLTFKEYAELWLRSDVSALCKKSTGENYRGFLNKHILPAFGNLKVTDINRGRVKNFLLEMVGNGYSKSYAGQFKNVISGVLNKAVDDEVIQASLSLHLGKNFLKIKDNKDTINALTPDELKTTIKYR